jgi:hypothetical protein
MTTGRVNCCCRCTRKRTKAETIWNIVGATITAALIIEVLTRRGLLFPPGTRPGGHNHQREYRMTTSDIEFNQIIDGLIDQEARDLHESLHLGHKPYRNGDERKAADRVITVIGPEQREAVLRFLVHDEVSRVVACLSLLDECDEVSYAAEDEVSAKLADTVIAQDRVATAIRELVTHMICNRAEVIAVVGVPA